MKDNEERVLYWIWRGNTTKTIPEHIEVMTAYADEIRAEAAEKAGEEINEQGLEEVTNIKRLHLAITGKDTL